MRSINRSKNHAILISKLREKDPKTGIAVFSTIKALQCYAAVLGFDHGRREKFDRKDTDNIEWHTFNNDDYTQYIYLSALAEANSMDVLKYDVEQSDFTGLSDDMVKIFEEYAHGGFNILQNWLDKNPADTFGAKAIISSLHKKGYLDDDAKKETEFDEVNF